MHKPERRETWSPEHRAHAFWFEKFVGVILLTGGLYGVLITLPPMQYFMIALCAFGLNATLPSARPLFSSIVDRLPFLANKGGD